MNYFEKIAAYSEGQMSEMERSIFEQELSEHPLLQQELEAYEDAQNIFDFVGKQLTQEEILEPGVEDTITQLFDFAATHLTEVEIIAPFAQVERKPQVAVVRRLRFQKYWLIAASLLFVFGLVGMRFWTAMEQPELSGFAVKEMPQIPVEQVAKVEIPVQEEKIVATPLVAKTSSKKPIRKAKPTKKDVLKKTDKPASPLASPSKQRIAPLIEPLPSVLNPIAFNALTASEISAGSIIEKGKKVKYQADYTVTLKPGFQVEAGADFLATSLANSGISKKDLAIAAIISDKEAVVYKAGQSITLKAGFHAKAGADFVAMVGE